MECELQNTLSRFSVVEGVDVLLEKLGNHLQVMLKANAGLLYSSGRNMVVPTSFQAFIFLHSLRVLAFSIKREACRIVQVYTTRTLIGLGNEPACKDWRMLFE